MKAPPFLLDTHAWVWFLTGSDMLPVSLRARLEEARQEKRLFISAITPWEVAVLARKGRIVFSLDPKDWLEAASRPPSGPPPERLPPPTHSSPYT